MSASSKLEAVQLLLKYGANPNPPGLFGRTSLHTALYLPDDDKDNRYETIKCLLEHGADLSCVDNDNNSPEGLAQVFFNMNPSEKNQKVLQLFGETKKQFLNPTVAASSLSTSSPSAISSQPTSENRRKDKGKEIDREATRAMDRPLPSAPSIFAPPKNKR